VIDLMHIFVLLTPMGIVILRAFFAFIFFFGLNDCMTLTLFRYFGWASLHANNEPSGGYKACMSEIS
jgi:hypothetical protein